MARMRLLRLSPTIPAVVLLGVFLGGPIVWALVGSLTDAALSGPRARNVSFVGLDNYLTLFTSASFPAALVLTLVFVVASAIVGQTVCGLVLALLLRSGSRVVGAVVSTIVVTAWVLPEIVAAFACYAFFNDQGTLNQVIGAVGLTGENWLYVFPMVAVCLANTWRGTAFSMMTYQAALGEIPSDVKEAAAIDGAGRLRTVFSITLPMIRRSISSTLMLVTLQTLSVFTLIWVMTSGGPSSRSTTLPILAYQEAFQAGAIGYGTAIAVVMLLVGGVFAVVYVRALRDEEQTR
ncbi:MAG: sugar ABC transporter permease [Microbacterium sp.]